MKALSHLLALQIHIEQIQTCLARNTPYFQNVLGVKIGKKKVEKRKDKVNGRKSEM
jgi:hypothetical protein